MSSETVRADLEDLRREPYLTILCYPKPQKTMGQRRIRELRRLEITSLKFVGDKEISRLRVLGKGCVGVVVQAFKGKQRVALKIRRVDAARATMQMEAKLLAKANSEGVGPKLLGAAKDFLVTEFVDGILLPEWIKSTKRKKALRTVLRDALEQCWRLDGISLDHGELSHAPKHVIVDKADKPVIVDFESASVKRRPANVTSLCQFLFIGSETARSVAERLGRIGEDAVIEALRQYKRSKARRDFEKVLAACGL
jgi:putative serine/threonine protein kinase